SSTSARLFVLRANLNAAFVPSRSSAARKIHKFCRSGNLVRAQSDSSNSTRLWCGRARFFLNNHLHGGAACGSCRRSNFTVLSSQVLQGVLFIRPCFHSRITGSRLLYIDARRCRESLRSSGGLSPSTTSPCHRPIAAQCRLSIPNAFRVIVDFLIAK